MNTTPRILRWPAATLGAALLVVAPAIVHASDSPQPASEASTKLSAPVFLASSGDSSWSNSSGWYVTGDVGFTSMPDVDATTPSFAGVAQFNDGYRLGLTLGKSVYSASDFDASLPDNWSVSAELEAAYLDNSLKSIISGGASNSANGELTQIPVLINLVWNYNITDNWSTYIGFGGGIARMDLTVDSVGGVPVNYETTETDGVIQAKIGLRYKITDNSSVGFGYKYLDILHTGLGTDVDTHTFFIDYNWRF